MGFMESVGPFFGKNVGRPSGSAKFDLNRKYTTTELKQRAMDLKRDDRQKLFGMLKEEGRWGKSVSNRQLMAMFKKRHSSGGEFNRIVSERIKDKILVTKNSEINQDKIRRNIRLTIFDRLREESKNQRPKQPEQSESGLLSGAPSSGERPAPKL